MNVFDEIASGKYENHVPFSVEHEPVDAENMTGKQVREIKERNDQNKRNQRRLHGEEQARLDGIFKADLEAEHGVTGHPKAGKLFEIAWQHGHSDGYTDVANYYADIVELIQP